MFEVGPERWQNYVQEGKLPFCPLLLKVYGREPWVMARGKREDKDDLARVCFIHFQRTMYRRNVKRAMKWKGNIYLVVISKVVQELKELKIKLAHCLLKKLTLWNHAMGSYFNSSQEDSPHFCVLEISCSLVWVYFLQLKRRKQISQLVALLGKTLSFSKCRWKLCFNHISGLFTYHIILRNSEILRPW